MQLHFLKKIKSFLLANVTSSVLMAMSVVFTGRLYTPSQFGDFGVFVSLTTIASSIMFLRFEQCVLNHYKKYSISISQLSALIGLIVIILLYPVLILYGLVGVALCSFFICLNSLYVFFCTRHLKYNEAGWIGLIRVVIMIIVQVMLSDSDLNGLIVGYASSYVITTVPFIITICKVLPKRTTLTALLKRNATYCLYGLPQTLLNTMLNNLVPLFLSAVYNVVIVGYYTMAMRCIQLPHRVIVNAIRGVVTSTYSDKSKSQRKAFFYKSTGLLFLIAVIIFPIGVVSADSIIEISIGTQWLPASSIVAILSIWMFFSFINVPAVSYLSFTKNTKALLKMEVFFGFLKISSGLISWILNLDYLIFIGIFSVASAIHSVYAIFYVHRGFGETSY
ncbi:lipopolysaccharide biosynthesis protein [Aeromonas media]|uniref:lipopolysaccharide biosynthesis protein n=1 Tax=Aeromonas media TaxID=651 RepID=UPI002282C306|nr:oligosaccharide flippase family protein [Aeromonas media]MCY9821477.1 oligosaccharide flippase family protein [Aeromonas media]